MGALTSQQIEAGRQYQAQQAQKGTKLSLADALVQQGVLTTALKQNIEKRLGPKVIGPYQLLGKIGEGAMGAVYRAKVVKTGIEVALKLLPKKFSEDQSYIARFLREAKAGLELEHEHVVRTVDFGDFEGVYFIALELVQGGDLNKKLKASSSSPSPTRCASSTRSRWACSTPTRRAWSTATSSPATSCSRRTGRPS
jgi:serine/threonine protein kinase